jgi:FtsP/CotA-like multicopper oxidase with cupredoxin domain
MYKETTTKGRHSLSLSRRRFVQGLAAGGAIAALGCTSPPRRNRASRTGHARKGSLRFDHRLSARELRFQEQTGVVGAIIIEPRDKELINFDREYVVLLTDWTDTSPETVFSNLKEQSDYYNYHQRTAGTFLSDIRKMGLRSTISNRMMWGRMNMSPTDIADVTGATYTYLLNGNTPNANWTGLFQPGERVRLRFIQWRFHDVL